MGDPLVPLFVGGGVCFSGDTLALSDSPSWSPIEGSMANQCTPETAGDIKSSFLVVSPQPGLLLPPSTSRRHFSIPGDILGCYDLGNVVIYNADPNSGLAQVCLKCAPVPGLKVGSANVSTWSAASICQLS